jgi:hypothetical protein
MFDLTRYKGLLVVGAGLLCALALFNAVLLAAFGQRPELFNDPDKQLAWSQLERMGGQVAGVEQRFSRRSPDDKRSLSIVLGQSTTLRGIDPELLGKMSRPRTRWLLLNGFGSSFMKLNYYAQTLLASRLRPETIALGLHTTMLAGQDRDNEPESDNPDKGENHEERDWRVRRYVMQLIWVRTQRADISHHTNMMLFDLRLALHRKLGSGALGLFRPKINPWRAEERDELPARHEERIKRQKNNWRAFGWFDAATYTTTSRHADAFRELIAGCDALGPKRIVIIQMPITSDLRGWLPPEADTAMQQLIDEVSVGRSIRVLDLRDAMPDDAFADYAHLNPAGREVFTAILAEQLNLLNIED